MEPNMAPRRLWHVVRAVLFMLRKGVSRRRKLSMDLQLILHRSKIAGKALGKLITAGGHHDDHPSAAAAPFSRRALDPALAVYNRRGEVEFSCSNTPSSYQAPIQLVPAKQRGRRRNNSSRRTHRGANGAEPGWYNYDAADIAKVFEVLNDEQLLNEVVGDGDGAGAAALAVLATPSPALWSSFGRSPAAVRQLRITDSPFPVRDDAAEQADGGMVDQEADEFIRKFYAQLRTQQSLAVATPEYGYARPATGIAY